jgi:hypothetical protein
VITISGGVLKSSQVVVQTFQESTPSSIAFPFDLKYFETQKKIANNAWYPWQPTVCGFDNLAIVHGIGIRLCPTRTST